MINDNIIKEIYWSRNLSLDEVMEKGKECDVLRIWYPQNLNDGIYERYGDTLAYIELEGKWKGKAYSSVIDLSQNETEIMSLFSKTRRYEIRRAIERDALHTDFYQPANAAECKEFVDYYNSFARSKGMADIVEDKVYALADNDKLIVAKISSPENEILSMHGYIADEADKRAALYTSSSLFRGKKDIANLIGRANGLLHYQSMLYFKKKGYAVYDFGGIYMGNNNIQHQNVAQFKMSLGGTLVEFDNGVIIPFRYLRGVDAFLEKNIDLFKKKKTIIWGAGQDGKYLLNCMARLNISVSCIIDNKLSEENDIYVKDTILAEYEPKDTIIVVTTSIENYIKIAEQESCRKYVSHNSLICMKEEIAALCNE